MSRPKTRNALLAALALLLAAWWLWPSQANESRGARGGDFDLLANRIWIDQIPTNERDKINVFILFDDPSFGAFTTSSAYEGDWAVFEWSLEKGLVLHMLQADKKHRVHPKLASGAKCAPFDHCLTLKGTPRGPKKYGSMEDWIIDGQSEFDVRQSIAALLAEAN